MDYFSSEALRKDLKRKTVQGGLYTVGTQVVLVGLQFAVVPILGRLLTPADFGLVAMVAVFTQFAAMFIDAGLSTATIQRDEITREQVTNLFWVATSLGTLIALVVAAMAPAIAWFYGEPRLMPITLALVISFICSGLTIQHQALLRRGMRYRSLAAIQITSFVIGQGVGIAWAWMYRSYWALVLIPIVSAAARMVGTWIMSGWTPGLPQRGTNVRPMIGFGAYLTGFSLINYIARNIDYMLIGWYWGATPLGLYERAYRLLMQPLSQINTPMSYVAVPALSRLANDPPRYRIFWRRGCTISAFVQAPIVVCLALVAQELVLTLLGPQWVDAIPIFRGLIPAMLLSFTAPATSWVYVSSGRPDKQLKASLASLGLTIAGFVVALPYGAAAMAWSYSITLWIMRLPTIMYCFSGTPLRLQDLWIAARSPVLATIGAATVAMPIYAMVDFRGPVLVQLILKSAVFAAAYLTLTLTLAEGREFWKFLISLVKTQLQPDASLPGKDMSRSTEF